MLGMDMSGCHILYHVRSGKKRLCQISSGLASWIQDM